VTDKTRVEEDDDSNVRNVYVLTATVSDGTIRLSGTGLEGDTIVVPAGEDAVVKIKDPSGFYLYGAEVPQNGERSACWGRNTVKGLARRKFEAVSTELNNIVYAAASRNSADITYGPVIKVKPKG
jgi:hypothetical protein